MSDPGRGQDPGLDPARSVRGRDPGLELALALGEMAGTLLVDGFGQARQSVATKSSSTDMVSEMDHAAEAVIVDNLRRAYPQDSILGEEGSAFEGTSGMCWVIDPLDGTTNYLYGHTMWAVSIARQNEAGQTVLGVVHHPLAGETFWARPGGGAWMESRPGPIRLRLGPTSELGERASELGERAPELGERASELGQALLGTGFSYDPAVRSLQGEILSRILGQVRDVRRAGSAALDLCWVAAGRLDGYWEANLAPWDRAAGALIASEAGATVEEFDVAGGSGSGGSSSIGSHLSELRVTLAARPGLGSALSDLVKSSSSI